jgi:hypothetical protein
MLCKDLYSSTVARNINQRLYTFMYFFFHSRSNCRLKKQIKRQRKLCFLGWWISEQLTAFKCNLIIPLLFLPCFLLLHFIFFCKCCVLNSYIITRFIWNWNFFTLYFSNYSNKNNCKNWLQGNSGVICIQTNVINLCRKNN